MDQEMEDYVRGSIDHSLGVPVSSQILELKLRASEEAQMRLRGQYFHLQARLRDKDETIERVRSESSMNAQALKKFVEENQKLAVECSNLLGQCKRWEKECSLYDHDREALMDFGNEADQRAKEAEIRVRELEDEVRRLCEELQSKHHREAQLVDTSSEERSTVQNLIGSLLTTLVAKDEVASTAKAFLEANSGVEVCKSLLKMWNCLGPTTRSVLALAAEFKTLEKDKEHLRVNLTRAEEEVNVLFEENNMLAEENMRLMKQLHREKHTPVSGGKPHTSSAYAKSNKRKSSPKMNSPIEKRIDFGDADMQRQPLSNLHPNSPESRVHKK